MEIWVGTKILQRLFFRLFSKPTKEVFDLHSSITIHGLDFRIITWRSPQREPLSNNWKPVPIQTNRESINYQMSVINVHSDNESVEDFIWIIFFACKYRDVTMVTIETWFFFSFPLLNNDVVIYRKQTVSNHMLLKSEMFNIFLTVISWYNG